MRPSVVINSGYLQCTLLFKKCAYFFAGHADQVSLLGRTGVFQYNNSDNSIEMGFLLADKFLAAGDRRSVYQAKVKAVSY